MEDNLKKIIKDYNEKKQTHEQLNKKAQSRMKNVILTGDIKEIKVAQAVRDSVLSLNKKKINASNKWTSHRNK